MKLFAIAAMLMFTTAAIAETAPAEPEDFCERIGGLAEAVMDARQRGVALSQIMTKFDPNREGADSPEVDELIRDMALSAYQQSQYSTPEIRNQVIADFRNDHETACYLAGADK
jgi:hypothetical protein